MPHNLTDSEEVLVLAARVPTSIVGGVPALVSAPTRRRRPRVGPRAAARLATRAAAARHRAPPPHFRLVAAAVAAVPGARLRTRAVRVGGQVELLLEVDGCLVRRRRLRSARGAGGRGSRASTTRGPAGRGRGLGDQGQAHIGPIYRIQGLGELYFFWN